MTAPVAALASTTDAGALPISAAQGNAGAQSAAPSSFDALIAAFFAAVPQTTAADPAQPEGAMQPQSSDSGTLPAGPRATMADLPAQALAHAADEARSAPPFATSAASPSPEATGAAPPATVADAAAAPAASVQTDASSALAAAVDQDMPLADPSQPIAAAEAEAGAPVESKTAPKSETERPAVEPPPAEKKPIVADAGAASDLPATLAAQMVVPQGAGAPAQAVAGESDTADSDDVSPRPVSSNQQRPLPAQPDTSPPQATLQSASASGRTAATADPAHPMAIAAARAFAGLLASVASSPRPAPAPAASQASKGTPGAPQPADKSAANTAAVQPKFAAPSVAPPAVHTKPDAPVAPQAPAARNDPARAPSPNAAPPAHAAQATQATPPRNDGGAPAFTLPQSAAPATPAFIHAAGADSSQPGPAAPAASDVPVRLAAVSPGDPSADFAQLALHVAAKSAGGDSHFLVRLDPPELGRVEVNLNVDSQGNARATLSADQPKTLDLLQRDAPALERALKDAGLDLAGGLSFSLKNGGGSGQRSADSSPRPRALRIEATSDASAPAMPSSLFQRNWGAAKARLDITV